MFWEIDQSGHEKDMDCISKYLLSFFEFASKTSAEHFDKAEWKAFAGEDGEWLYDLYTKDYKSGEDMRGAIRELFGLPLDVRRKIYQAIDHDMKFARHHTSEFEFQSIEPYLEKEQCKIIRDFFIYFYKEIFCSDHFQLEGLSCKDFGRKEFARRFFLGKNEVLKRVCPVCLQAVTDGEKEDDVEHYFGKMFVPCLALHPYNLHFTCKSCNQTYKHIKKPMMKKSDIRNVFLPYLDTVRSKTKLEFYHGEKKDGLRLLPEDADEPFIAEKIKSFNSIFRLENRWSGLLKGYYESLRSDYTVFPPASLEDLESEMKRDIIRGSARCRKRPEQYIEEQYRQWVSKYQLKALYSEITQSGRKAVVDKHDRSAHHGHG